MLYAIFVNVTMGQVILHLTPLPSGPFTLEKAYIDWVVLGVLFGIPIAYNTYKYYGVETK